LARPLHSGDQYRSRTGSVLSEVDIITYHAAPQAQYPRPPAHKPQIFLNIASILVVLWALFEALGLANLFAFAGLTNDDADAAASSMVLEGLFDPIGFAIMLALLTAALVIHLCSRAMRHFSNAMTRTGLIITTVLFVLSFFRISMLLPFLFGSLGMMSNEGQNGPDERTPTAEEFSLEPAQLITYREAQGVRISGALANISDEPWQAATVSLSFSDAAGTVCGQFEHVEEFVSAGERRPMTTQFMDAAGNYDSASCTPVSATAELVRIDVDTRSESATLDYESNQPVPAFASLAPVEQEVISGIVELSVAGVVAPESLSVLREGSTLPVGFEVVDQQGLRLNWCFEPSDVAPDGSFTTRDFHSPVDPGEFPTVVVVPEC
jgi:hypothetical protein